MVDVMPQPMDLFLAEVPYTDQKERTSHIPVLIVAVRQTTVAVFKITTRYADKSQKIRNVYYPIKDWMEAGLVKQSYVDVHRQIVLKTATVIQRQPIGKLSVYDAAQLLAFIKAHTEAILKIRQDDQRQFGV